MSKKLQRRSGDKTPRSQKVKINLTIDQDLERKFREAISKKYGYKKGNMQLAIEDAIKDWIQKQESPAPKKQSKT